MSLSQRTPKWAWIILGALILLIILAVWLGPDEQTLGSGIKTVYVHVGLTWAGMAGLGMAAFLGLGVLLTAKPGWAGWLQTVSWVATILYGAGIFMSMVASKDNWGGILLQEPRMAAALNGFAIALIVAVLSSWLPWLRLRGLLAILVFGLILWLNGQAELLLHPPNPVRTTESSTIQLTFLSIFVLFSMVGAWLVLYFHRLKQN